MTRHVFKSVDSQQAARTVGIEVSPISLLLFGGPAPGAKAMSAAGLVTIAFLIR